MAHERYEDCLAACNACADECERCVDGCLSERDMKTMADCIRLARDGADISRLAAALMSRDSRFALRACDLCAVICDACARECEKHDADHCRACAEACRECAEECRRMSQGAQPGVAAASAHHA